MFCFCRTRRDRGRRTADLRVAGTDVLLSAPRSRPSDVVVLRHQQNASQHPSNGLDIITLFLVSLTRYAIDTQAAVRCIVLPQILGIRVNIKYTLVLMSSFFFCFGNVPQLCDVSLRVGNSVTKAHRLVLASSSPYFYAMFNGKFIRQKNVWVSFFLHIYLIRCFCISTHADDMAEKLQSEVELHDVDIGALQLLVEYSYTGQVHITDENVQVMYIYIYTYLFNNNYYFKHVFTALIKSNRINIHRYKFDILIYACSFYLTIKYIF